MCGLSCGDKVQQFGIEMAVATKHVFGGDVPIAALDVLGYFGAQVIGFQGSMADDVLHV